MITTVRIRRIIYNIHVRTTVLLAITMVDDPTRAVVSFEESHHLQQACALSVELHQGSTAICHHRHATAVL